MSATLPPDLRALVLARVRETPSADVRATRRRNAIAIVLAGAAAATMIAALGIALGGRPLPFVALSVTGWAAIAFAGTVVSGSRGEMMLGRARSVLVVCALALAPALFSWMMGCAALWPGVSDRPGTLQTHVACLVATMILSLGPTLALSYMRRGSDPVHPRATGAAIGAAAGAWGGVLIDMHCPISRPLHVALAHVMPVVIYATIGALLGARLFGVRASRKK